MKSVHSGAGQAGGLGNGDPGGGSNREIELKLGLAPGLKDAVFAHERLQTRIGVAKMLESIYYDTPALDLYRQGVSLRIRIQDSNRVQTVKRAGAVAAGLSDRSEWERPWAGHFDFSGVGDPQVVDLLERCRNHLMPVFSTSFHREERLFQEGSVAIRVTIDEGVIRAGDLHEPLCELELELDAGRPIDLLRLALMLTETLPLWPEDRSKAERGYRLCGGVSLPEQVVPAPFTPVSSAVDSFRALVAGEVRRWQRSLRLVEADPVEGVHQTRTTLRRLRALVRLFESELPAGFGQVWRLRLGDVARELGNLRELDVCCDEVLAKDQVKKSSDHEDESLDGALQVVREHLEAERSVARDLLAPCLGLASQGRLMLEFMAAVTEAPDAPEVLLVDMAHVRMEWLRKRLRKRVKALPAEDAEAWHALRIAAKQLRHGLDFLAPLWPERAVAGYRRPLAAIQRRLGRLQDWENVVHRLRDQDTPESAVVRRWLQHSYSRRVARWRRRSLEDARELLAQKPPWKRPPTDR